MNPMLKVIRTLAQLEELEAYIDSKEFLAYDTETTGLETDAEIVGFSVSGDVDLGYYVILSHWDVAQKKLVYLETREAAPKVISKLRGKQLVMHNTGFDCQKTQHNFGIDLMPSIHTDTMILAHLLDENRSVRLKDLAVSIYGEDVRKEELEMKASVLKNGGIWQEGPKGNKEMYKADSEILAKYGAQDAVLTMKLFYHLVPELFEQKLDQFFYDDESMPLLRGPTYQLNTTGLRVDPQKLQDLKGTLEAECMEAKAFIQKEVAEHVKERYPGTSKVKTFNIGSSKQIAWLLFFRLGQEFNILTKEGRNLCKGLDIKIPYSPGAKREFIRVVEENKGRIWQEARINPKTKKMGRPKKVSDPWNYIAAGKATLDRFAKKYRWVEKLLEFKKNDKILNTYVIGIQSRMRYNIIRPQFKQHGTTSGRYSSSNPNFQNLPKDDKRVKACIVSRPGKVFVGADEAQLEPRVFCSISKDTRLMGCFAAGDDFYSVVGAPTFGKTGCGLRKGEPGSFSVLYPKLRDDSKVFGLATPYGRTAREQAQKMGIGVEEAQTLIDNYFAAYPNVELMMLESHEEAKRDGVVYSLYGRPRRIPEAKKIPKVYGNTPHSELPYVARTLLNLAMNHKVQSTAATIMNRNAIAFVAKCWELAKSDRRWLEVLLVLQVHDELVVEAPEALAEQVATVLQDAMQNTVTLPGVELIAEPKIAYNLADLK